MVKRTLCRHYTAKRTDTVVTVGIMTVPELKPKEQRFAMAQFDVGLLVSDVVQSEGEKSPWESVLMLVWHAGVGDSIADAPSRADHSSSPPSFSLVSIGCSPKVRDT